MRSEVGAQHLFQALYKRCRCEIMSEKDIFPQFHTHSHTLDMHAIPRTTIWLPFASLQPHLISSLQLPPRVDPTTPPTDTNMYENDVIMQ